MWRGGERERKRAASWLHHAFLVDFVVVDTMRKLEQARRWAREVLEAGS